MTMDSQGQTSYVYNVYPPPFYELSPLHTLNHRWGPFCSATVRWGASKQCTSDRQCHPGVSTCLPLNNNSDSSQKICFSTATFKRSIQSNRKKVEKQLQPRRVRQPCFNTFHCQDGMVCLADGGCAPLYLHMWNDPSNAWPIEFTVLADSCGFKEKLHPYTQSSRGASPWEHVPDLLHAHGMCSHRNWFSYRHSIRTRLCPSNFNAPFMSCKGEDTNWPWVFQSFNFEKMASTSTTSRQTISQEKLLLAKSHPCDDKYMHMQVPGQAKRMEVCSGYEGHQITSISTNANAYFSYILSKPAAVDSSSGGGGEQQEATWVDSVLFPGTSIMLNHDNNESSSSGAKSISRWMRTYSEATGAVDIGIIQAGPEYDVPLGFLGASKLEDDVLGDMAKSKDSVRFFRCSDRLSCSSPPFRYNGVSVNRINPETMSSANFSETSLRICGGIGYLPQQQSTTSAGGGICVLDIQLFPLFSQLLWGGEDDGGGCGMLWSEKATFVILTDAQEDSDVWNIIATSSPSSLFCTKAHKKKCVYAARPSSRLTHDNVDDSVT